MSVISRIVSICIVVAIGAGCTIATPARNERAVGDQSQPKARDRYKNEWDFNKKKGVPQWGLSLSGGGTRSASFSIGVLKALNESGVLNDIDIISTVSGGGYALYWLYMHEYYREKQNYEYERDTLFESFDFQKHGYTNYSFDIYENYGINHPPSVSQPKAPCSSPLDDKCRFQRHLENNSYLLVKSKGRLYQYGEYTLKGALWMTSTIANVVGNWIFGGDFNVNPLRRFYENGIERTYGLVPHRRGEKDGYYNSEPFFMDDMEAEDVEFSELREFLIRNRNECDRRLPYFVINTTADYSNADSWFSAFAEKETNLSKVIFEFTPLDYGSDAFNYRNHNSKEEIHFSKAIAISGAAIDYKANELNFLEKFAVTAADLSLGYKLDNYELKSPRLLGFVADFPLPRIPIFPLYYLNNYIHDRNATAIHLSDGGHVENLGVFSLIRREVKNIIVVDAEQDAGSKYEGLNKLRTAIKREMDLDLCINIKRNNSDKINKNNSDKKIKRKNMDKAVRVFDTPQSVFEGKILKLGKGETCNDTKSEAAIRIIYLKLSIDKKKADPLTCEGDCYPWTVVNYYSNSRVGSDGKKKKKNRNKFPHESTADIEYGPDQFRAYRDLGYTLACNQLFRALQEIDPTKEKTCRKQAENTASITGP